MSHHTRNNSSIWGLLSAFSLIALLSGCAAFPVPPANCPDCGRHLNHHVSHVGDKSPSNKLIAKRSSFYAVPTRPVFEPVSALLLQMPKQQTQTPKLESIAKEIQKKQPTKTTEESQPATKSKKSVAPQKKKNDQDRVATKETQDETESAKPQEFQIGENELSKLPVLNAPETGPSKIKLTEKPKSKHVWRAKRKPVRK